MHGNQSSGNHNVKIILLIVLIVVVLVIGLNNDVVTEDTTTEPVVEVSDYALFEKGTTQLEETYCREIVNEDVKNACYSVIEYDSKKCLEVEDKTARQDCLIRIGEAMNDNSICEQERDGEIREICDFYFNSVHELDTQEGRQICEETYELTTSLCFALQKKDISYCDVLANYESDTDSEIEQHSDLALWCKVRVTKDGQYCEQLSDDYWDKHNCLLDVAKTVDDCNAIDYSNEPYEINECMAHVTGDEEYCKKLPKPDMWDCLAYINEDPSYCEEHTVFEWKWDCLAEWSNDPNVCDNYHDAWCEEYQEI